MSTLCELHRSSWVNRSSSLPQGRVFARWVSSARFFSKSKATWIGLRSCAPHAGTIFSSRSQNFVPKLAKVHEAARCMFTGIVEEMGTIAAVGPVEDDGFEMTINASIALDGVKLGDSIAVNGTCLTVTRFDDTSFSVGLAPETLRKTSLGEVSRGSYVNLERSVQPTSRMGGHFVQGHVDGTGTIIAMDREGDSLWVKVQTSADILRYIVPKGYIAVDGTSLTVVKVFDDEHAFNFMLVAYTQQKIVIPLKSVGSKVNLEVDILGKYVERLLAGYSTSHPQAI